MRPICLFFSSKVSTFEKKMDMFCQEPRAAVPGNTACCEGPLWVCFERSFAIVEFTSAKGYGTIKSPRVVPAPVCVCDLPAEVSL